MTSKYSGHTYSDGKNTWAVEDIWRHAAVHGVGRVMDIGDIADIEALLDSHCWSAGPMSVREILDHCDRVQKADLERYPIILTPTGSIADGVHRLIKAVRAGHEAMWVVRLISMPAPLENHDTSIPNTAK